MEVSQLPVVQWEETEADDDGYADRRCRVDLITVSFRLGILRKNSKLMVKRLAFDVWAYLEGYLNSFLPSFFMKRRGNY